MNENRLSMIKLNRNHSHLFVKRFFAQKNEIMDIARHLRIAQFSLSSAETNLI